MSRKFVFLEEDSVEDASPQRPEPRRLARRLVRRIVATGLAIAFLAGCGVGWVAVRGGQASDHLHRAAELVQQLRQQVESGDATAAASTLAALQHETRAARADTGDPVWRIGQRAPAVGDDLAAFRTLAVALDDLAHDGLPPLVKTAGRLDLAALAPSNGRVDLTGLQEAAPGLAAADTAIRRARDRVAAIPVESLVARLRNAVLTLRRSLDRASTDTATATRTAVLLPAMLGADGPRTYLVLFQNLAEVRATGGMPGAYAVLRANQGAIEIIEQRSATAGLETFDSPVLPLDPALRALYSDRMAKFPADINFSPDFPTAAVLAREMYRLRSGRTVDGVLATDPVALSYLLAALGPVPVPAGPTLTAENAVRVLLSETYARAKSSAEQDEYFSAAAMATFQALMQRPLDPPAVLAQLARAAGERRILLWSADPAQEQRLLGTVLAGALPVNDGRQPTVGVFLNDGSGAKLSYYLTHSAELSVGGCRTDNRRELILRVTLGSTAPATGLPEYVLGLGLSGDPYTVRTNVAVYSPTGGTIGEMKLDGVVTPIGSGAEGRRAVGILPVDLKPGATRTIEAALLTGVPVLGWGTSVNPRLWTTPGVTDWPIFVRSADACPHRQ